MPTKEELIARLRDDSEHHIFSPSGATQWLTCGMSVWEQFDLPDTTSEAAIEGTAAHTLAEICLKEGVKAAQVDGFTEEMKEYVQQFVDYVAQTAEGGRVWIEQRVDLNQWIPGGKGTADVIAIVKDTLHIIDLKYGKGVQVFAEDNSQLKLYALGAIAKIRQSNVTINKVNVHIAQPRLRHWDSWEIDPSDLDEFGTHVSAWINKCVNKEVDYNPSERACQWCKAQATCTALYKHNLAIVSKDFEPIAPAELTDEQLKLIVENKALIEKWLKSVEAHVFSRLEQGGEFPGFKMVEGRSQRRYNDKAAEVLEKILGDEAYEKKLITVTAAEKAIGKKQFSELGITSKPAGKPTLVPESDKRKAILISDDFQNLEG